MGAIERTSAVPYYEQLHKHLLDRIRKGEFRRGERLPGESELHRDFDVSRATARQALELLETNGWARKIARRGFFVTSPDEAHGWLIEELGGFLEQTIAHGEAGVTTTIVAAGMAAIPDLACSALEIPPNSLGFVLERVRKVDGEFVLFSTNYAPREVAPAIAGDRGVLDGTSSLNEALGAAGYTAGGAHRVIHALGAPRNVAKHLEIPAGAPLVRIRSTMWTPQGLRYDYYETWLRTDVVPLQINITARRRNGSN